MKKYAKLAVVNSKIFSFADCLFSFFPKGAVLSSILRVRFYRIRFGESFKICLDYERNHSIKGWLCSLGW